MMHVHRHNGGCRDHLDKRWLLARVANVAVDADGAGAAITSAHATFRSPNLKARLGSARDEFRALW